MRKIIAITFIIMAAGVMSAQTPGAVTAMEGVPGEKDVIKVVSAEKGAMAEDGVQVSEARIERSEGFLKVAFEMDLSGLKVPAGRAVLLTPRIVSETDSLDLPPVGIYGRTRYYFYMRNGMLAEESYRWRERPDSVRYSRVLEMPDRAEDGPLQLLLRSSEYGCCGTLTGQGDVLLAEAFAAPPDTVRAAPPEPRPVREHSLSGSAFIDFAVDRADIREDYLNNLPELRKIRVSIDSVSGDPDISVTGIRLKGFASPEGAYGHNAELAQARTEALKTYLQDLYGFEDGLIETDFEAEDWEGLREYVSTYGMEHRTGILELIDGDLEPDAKERELRRAWPDEYKFLLDNVFPYLRRTDYTISYIIRESPGPEETDAVERDITTIQNDEQSDEN